MDYKKVDWNQIAESFSPYLSEKEKEWLDEYIFAGEYDLAFDLIVAYVLKKSIPLTNELYEWIVWYGKETEKLGNNIDPNWKEVKFT